MNVETTSMALMKRPRKINLRSLWYKAKGHFLLLFLEMWVTGINWLGWRLKFRPSQRVATEALVSFLRLGCCVVCRTIYFDPLRLHASQIQTNLIYGTCTSVRKPKQFSSPVLHRLNIFITFFLPTLASSGRLIPCVHLVFVRFGPF